METLKDHAQSIKQFIDDFEHEMDVTRERLSNYWSCEVGSELEQLANYTLFDLKRCIDALYAQCLTFDVLLVKLHYEKQNQV